MKKFIITILFLSFTSLASATHTKGGWMYYEYLGKGINDTTKLRYRIGLRFYTSCNNLVFEDSFHLSIFKANAPYDLVLNAPVSIATDSSISNCLIASCYPCLDIIPEICYWIRTYEAIVEISPNAAGFIMAKQRCCRVNGISNLTAPSDNLGETYSIQIPGIQSGLPNAHINSSPLFIFNDTTIVCGNNPMSFSFQAYDTDGDSLVYSFCAAQHGGDDTLRTNPSLALPPPYANISYATPYSGTSPLGVAVTIHPSSGLITGMAPPPGEYVLTVCVSEYRNGIYFASSKKELHLRIADCSPVKATLDPEFITCGDLTLTFSNQTDNISVQNWYWEFGDPTTGTNDSSTQQMPTHTFSDAGDYFVKLVVNKGLPCSDSTVQLLHVYPGFFPGFLAQDPFCTGKPVQFTDTTLTYYGNVSNWSWDFGDPSSTSDSSNLQNPVYTYQTAGQYTIRLLSGNSKGCKDSAYLDITVSELPTVNLLNTDTSYCKLDSLTLTATGTGQLSWSPFSHIQVINDSTVRVFPDTITQYQVIVNNKGCLNMDSVMLYAVNDVTNLAIANPATICKYDTLTLTGSSNKTNNVSWHWEPATSVLNPNLATTRANPEITTDYTLSTRWGDHCIATSTVQVPVKPLAVPFAGTDTGYCRNQDSVMLQASGGDGYTWTPASGLSNPNISNPMAAPNSSTWYQVHVSVNGCSRTVSDSILVHVWEKPSLAVTNDTLICSIDTLQLTATGTGLFQWTPSYHINNTQLSNPLVSPDLPSMYWVTLTDLHQCISKDSVYVDVKPFVTVNAGPDTTICQLDGYTLKTVSDALHYIWTPSDYLSSDTAKNPIATPPTTITYHVVANIGKCQSESEVKITVVPKPLAIANSDTTVCLGDTIQLRASGGSIYTWEPTQFLSNPNIANPLVINPNVSVAYVVTVSDTLGCPKISKDTVIVRLIPNPMVNAGPADTSLVEGETILLMATGAQNYSWSPGTWLSSTQIARPLASPEQDITYYLEGTDRYGCKGTDSIHIIIYRIPADMYVPTAFTPNGDGQNDVIRPIMIGMKSLNYFRIFNRFGEEVFYTTRMHTGWDGMYKGKAQDPGTFVWMAEGVTFKGIKKSKKGFVVLIR